MKRLLLVLLLSSLAHAECRAYFTVLESDEVTAGIQMLGFNKPQLKWYEKHGDQNGICYWDMGRTEKTQVSYQDFLSKSKDMPVPEPMYVIAWGEHLVSHTSVYSTGGYQLEDGRQVPTQVHSMESRGYVASGQLLRWDTKTQTLIPMVPLHNRNHSRFTSVSKSLLESGIEAIQKQIQ